MQYSGTISLLGAMQEENGSRRPRQTVRSINGGFAALFPQWRAIWKATGVHELERSDGASPGTVDWHPSFERDCMAQFPGYEDMPSEV